MIGCLRSGRVSRGFPRKSGTGSFFFGPFLSSLYGFLCVFRPEGDNPDADALDEVLQQHLDTEIVLIYTRYSELLVGKETKKKERERERESC